MGCLLGILFQFCSALKDLSQCARLEHLRGNGDWRQVKEGNVTQLVAHYDYMYAVGTDKAVYKFSLQNHGKWWKVAPGNVSSISIYDDILYGVLEDGSVNMCTLRRCKRWKKIDAQGSVSSIVVRDEFIFAIKPDMEDNAVWQTSWDGYWPYRRVTEGTTLHLAFTKNFMYGVDNDGGAWRTEFGKTPWTKIGGDLKVRHLAVQVSDCGGADIYAIGENFGVFKLPY